MTTKELIYKNALTLFAEQGYSNIGMRELAKNVGIKASSIYNHYKSKEDILFDIALSLVDEMKITIYPLFKKEYNNTKDFLLSVSLETNRFFERNDINTLTKLLIPEQYLIPKLKELLHIEFIQKPRTAYNYYFNSLMSKGKMRRVDSSLTAKMYHSFFVYHFYEKYLMKDYDHFFLTNLEPVFINHINLFIDYYQIT